MNKDFRTNLIAGAIGIIIGAASMHAAYQASDVEARVFYRPSVRQLNDDGYRNQESNVRAKHGTGVRPTQTQP